MIKPCTIYGLVDPRTDSVRYVGSSIHPRYRYGQHFEPKGRDTPVKVWGMDLAGSGMMPGLIMLEETDTENREFRERHWIAYYRALKQADLNQHLSPPSYHHTDKIPQGELVKTVKLCYQIQRLQAENTVLRAEITKLHNLQNATKST